MIVWFGFRWACCCWRIFYWYMCLWLFFYILLKDYVRFGFVWPSLWVRAMGGAHTLMFPLGVKIGYRTRVVPYTLHIRIQLSLYMRARGWYAFKWARVCVCFFIANFRGDLLTFLCGVNRLLNSRIPRKPSIGVQRSATRTQTLENRWIKKKLCFGGCALVGEWFFARVNRLPQTPHFMFTDYSLYKWL